MNIHQRTHKYAEGWSAKELNSKQKHCTQVAIVSLVAAIVLTILSFVFVMRFSLTITIMILISVIFTIIIAVLILLWFKQSKFEEQDLDILIVDERMSVAIFVATFCLILYNFFLFVFLLFWNRIGQDYFTAQNANSEDFQANYTQCLYYIVPLLILISACMGLATFVSYITITEKSKLNISIYLFALATIIFTVLALLYTNRTQHDSESKISPFQPSIILSIFKIEALILIILCLVVFLLAFMHRYAKISIFGYAILVMIFLLAGSSFIYFRESEKMRSQYLIDCKQQMRDSHSSWIYEETICQKYVQNINCPVEQLAVQWETNNEQGCLNINCCNATADSYSKNYFFGGFALLMLIISAFALSTTLLQSDSSPDSHLSQIQSTSRVVDYIVLLCLVGFGIFAVILLVSEYPIIPQNNLIIVEKEIKIKKNSNPIVYPSGMDGVTNCSPFILSNDITITGNSRVSILAPSLKIVVTSYPNSPKLSYLPVETGKILLYNNQNANDGFIGVQGDPTEIKEFLQQKVQICGKADKSKVQVDVHSLGNPTRLLYHAHKESSNFTPEQVSYVESLKFTNTKVIITDIHTNEVIEGALMHFYHSHDDCGKMTSIPYRLVTLSKELFNMQIKEYYYGIEKKGYYLFCSKFQVAENKPLEATLVPRNSKVGQFSVIIETPLQDKFDVILGASITECSVGFFNEDCAGMHFYGSTHAQAISVDLLAQRQYTFFIYFDPKDKKLRELNREKAQGKEIDDDEINNDYIFDTLKPKVTLYAHEQERPIERYSIPNLKEDNKQEPNLTWLVLCVNGEIGDISQKSPEVFWTYEDDPNQYQRSSDSKLIYPNVCTK